MSVKYDASMTQYHSVIATAIKRMCGRNKTAMDFVNDASPAPLRDFLKKTYKYNGAGDATLCYDASPTSVEIKSNKITNNDGSHSVVLSWSQVAKFIRDNAPEIFGFGEDVKEGIPISGTPDDNCVCGDKQIPKNEKIPAPAQSDSPAFDYSILDTDTAASLRSCETVIRTETAGYFTLLGSKLKEAQDLLANHSSGTFEQWYTAMGFKRQTVYNLIKRFEFSSSPTIGERAEVFEALPLTLSYEISKPDAPAELVNKVLDGDITSNSEYQKLKNELELAQEKAKNQSLTIDELLKQKDGLVRQNTDIELKLSNTEKKIKELEDRPVEVAIEADEAALAEKDKEISELQEKIERLSNTDVKSFILRMTLDEYERLTKITKNSKDPVIDRIVHNARLIKI